MNCVVDFHSAMKIRIDGLERAVEHIIELVRRLPCTSVDLDDVELALTEAAPDGTATSRRLEAQSFQKNFDLSFYPLSIV